MIWLVLSHSRGNAIRMVFAADLDVDVIEPRDADEALYAASIIGSFIPANTIIYIKDKVKGGLK